MKVILSRKGFDSTYGGYPSLILPDGELISLPIPSHYDTITYSKINSFQGTDLYSLMIQLNKKINDGNKIPLTINTTCHFDPDIAYYSYNRKDGWRGCFGQAGSAQRVLENNFVKEGDLFLFFGWFSECDYNNNKLSFKNRNGKHVLYGYLQIDKIIYPYKDEIPKWLEYHPHAKRGKKSHPKNCIYIAKKNCTFDNTLPGYGIFKYSPVLNLTKDGMTRSKWELPDIFREVSITYHNKKSWKDNYFQSACRGQEFVIEENDLIENWAINIIKENARR